MGLGGHKPGEVFRLKCVARNGPEVTFLSNQVSISAIFHQQEDADYFEVEKEYAVDFLRIAGGDSAGTVSPESQSSS